MRAKIVSSGVLIAASLCCLLLTACGETNVQLNSNTSTSSQAWLTTRFVDVEYAKVAGVSLHLNLYFPSTGNGPWPVIIWIHGGGWVEGGRYIKATDPPYPLIGMGFVVASLDYRFSDVAKFPAQIYDCKAAIRWLRAHTTTFKLDSARFGVWGDSAGGHLAALLGTSGGVSGLEDLSMGNATYSSQVQAVVDWYGPTDFLKMSAESLPSSNVDYNSPVSHESLLVGCAIQTCPDKTEQANPIKYVRPNAPPFLIMHGDQDVFVPPLQSQLLQNALKAAKIDSTLYIVPGGTHAWFTTPTDQQRVFNFFTARL